MNYKYFLTVTLMATLTFGCGGGSDKSSGGASIKGGLKGEWKTSCLSSGNESLILYASHDIIDGEPFYGEGTEFFDTSDCSGSPSASWKLGGPVSYTGAANSSICSAEKFDATFSLIEVNGKTYTGSDFDSVMNQLSSTLQRQRSSLACIYRDKYLEGLRSDGGRPDEVNPLFVFYPDS